MFPFHRKHGNNHNAQKQPELRRACCRPKSPKLAISKNLDFHFFIDLGREDSLTPNSRYRHGHRSSEENEMSDEEFLEYIHQNDKSRHQLTSTAHDRYCHKIIRDKEEILLSSLNVKDLEQSSDDDSQFSPRGIYLDLLPAKSSKYSESVSMPSSPIENKNFLRPENITRRKSDTEASSHNSPIELKNDNEYILTLKIDNLAADVEDISFFRIGPKQQCPQESSTRKSQGKYKLTEGTTDLSQASNNLEATRQKMNQYFVQYREVTSDTCTALKKLLIGSANHSFLNQWFRQCFSFSHIPISRWQLVQVKSGSCGVIAAVEAFIVRCLLFDPGFCKFKEPLRPNQKEIVEAFIFALAYILWQAGDFQKSVLLIPRNIDGKENMECNLKEVISESCAYVEYFNFESLKEAVAINMKYFTCPPYHGYLNFIMSAMLSRGISRVQEDMDEEGALITENGHCSLELVLLLITGRAVSNVFDFDIRIDSCLLKGVKKQSDIGFLSLFEYMNTCEVGSFLKSPKFPVWLVNCADHFTVLFSSKLEHAVQDIQQPFVLYHYDSMTAFSCESDVKLVIDTQSNYTDDQLEKDQSHLQLCIKTKWKNATVIYTENSELYLV